MKHLVVAFLLLVPAPLWAGAEVLQRPGPDTAAAWGGLPFADITAKPDTLAGYGITDAIQGDYPIVQNLVYMSDTFPVAPLDTTIYYPSHGELAGMICDVIAPPVGGSIALDLLTGTPLVSVYGAGAKPVIAAGDTTTLTGTPEALPTPVPLVPRTKIQVRVLSAPLEYFVASYATVADLPTTTALAGSRYKVIADNHIWVRNAYDAVVWTNTGLPAGGEWLGAVATASALPTATASGGAIWLVSDTARLWQMTSVVNGHVANQASLPAANSVAALAVYVTTDLSEAWQSDGAANWSLIGAAWSDRGQVILPNTAFTAIASSAALPTAALVGTWYLALDTGRLWRNDAPPWLDDGLITTFSGAGLRCALYIYPKVAP